VSAMPETVSSPAALPRVMQVVPNFSEGRDRAVIAEIVAALRDRGAEVLDWSADPDHHRCVVTAVGAPDTLEQASLAAAEVAVRKIDLRRHSGVHPRIGALDVLPFLPLLGVTLDDARAAARRTGERLAREVGVPVYFYGAADDAGRKLSELRSGGFERLAHGWPAEREPDVLPDRWQHAGAHPSAGATCVGARRLLLAWNVYVAGLTLADVRGVARELRDSNGGFRGVRALGLELPSRRRLQISMNIEDLDATSPFDVYSRIEERVDGLGGCITETEVIGMVPDSLIASAAQARLRLAAGTIDRLLSASLLRYVDGMGSTADNRSSSGPPVP
jgi:glutamate formiminotransferase